MKLGKAKANYVDANTDVEGSRYTIHSIKNVENQNRFLELIIYR